MKERLTKKVSGCFCYDLKDHKNVPGEFASYDAFFDYSMAVKRLGEYEDTGLEPEDINEFVNSYKTMRDNEEARVQLMCGTGAIHPERAAEITKAESEGRLLVLPCRVGDKVYQTDGIKIYESTVRQLIFDTENIAFDVCAIGKSVFRTREEAETKLKERGE